VAYDVDIADRLREILASEPGVVEKPMFGGLAFMVAGHMAVSASGQGGLLLRVDPAQTDALIVDPRASRFVMRGREMGGWLRLTSMRTRPTTSSGSGSSTVSATPGRCRRSDRRRKIANRGFSCDRLCEVGAALGTVGRVAHLAGS
jgi:hypothetical protein